MLGSLSGHPKKSNKLADFKQLTHRLSQNRTGQIDLFLPTEGINKYSRVLSCAHRAEKTKLELPD